MAKTVDDKALYMNSTETSFGKIQRFIWTPAQSHHPVAECSRFRMCPNHVNKNIPKPSKSGLVFGWHTSEYQSPIPDLKLYGF